MEITNILALLLIGLTAFIHIIFFIIESIYFMHPAILERLDLNAKEAKIVKPWAYNQGFYNLFLALGLIFAIYLIITGQVETGQMLASFILITLVGAGLVLFLSEPNRRTIALVQALPPLAGLIFL